MSSSGEMKMSLRLMICRGPSFRRQMDHLRPHEQEPPLTFSCRRCFKSFSSRYVRFESTGVLKGLTIFFTATAEPVN